MGPLDADPPVARLPALERPSTADHGRRPSQAEPEPIGQARPAGRRRASPPGRSRCRSATRCQRASARVRVDLEPARRRVAVARLADAARVQERPAGRRGGTSARARARSPRSARRGRPRPSAGGCGRGARTGSSGRRGWPGRPATEVTYSQTGSRGLPWTSVMSPSSRASPAGRQPGGGRLGDAPAGPFHRRLRVRVEPVDLAAADRGRDRGCRRRRPRRASRQPGDDRRPGRARSRRRRRGARRRRPSRRRASTASRATRLAWMSDSTATRTA